MRMQSVHAAMEWVQVALYFRLEINRRAAESAEGSAERTLRPKLKDAEVINLRALRFATIFLGF